MIANSNRRGIAVALLTVATTLSGYAESAALRGEVTTGPSPRLTMPSIVGFPGAARDEPGSNLGPRYLMSLRDGGFCGWPYSDYGTCTDTRAAPPRPGLVATAPVPDDTPGSPEPPPGPPSGVAIHRTGVLVVADGAGNVVWRVTERMERSSTGNPGTAPPSKQFGP